MRTWLLIASILLFALGSVPAINSAPIGYHKVTPEQSLVPVQQKKWAGKWKMGGKGKGKGMAKGKGKGKGPGCFDRCMAKSSAAMTAAMGCSARCK
jgi:hypothetical protein